MSENTKIQWADHTFNPWEGCTKISPGCAHCYADARAQRFGQVRWGKFQPRRRTSAANWRLPVKWNRAEATKMVNHAEFAAATRPRVFCASLADWLDDEVPFEWLADLLQLIHDTPNLDWLLLTKRPENWQARIAGVMVRLDSRTPSPTAEEEMNILAQIGNVSTKRFRQIIAPFRRSDLALWLGAWLAGKPPENVWIGASVEDQQRADARIPELLSIPAKVRFLSCEPLLEPVDLLHIRARHRDAVSENELYVRDLLHWCIIGGESGPRARPCNTEWVRSLVSQCRASGVAPFVKQLGSAPYFEAAHAPVAGPVDLELEDKKGGDPSEWPLDLQLVREFPSAR